MYYYHTYSPGRKFFNKSNELIAVEDSVDFPEEATEKPIQKKSLKIQTVHKKNQAEKFLKKSKKHLKKKKPKAAKKEPKPLPPVAALSETKGTHPVSSPKENPTGPPEAARGEENPEPTIPPDFENEETGGLSGENLFQPRAETQPPFDEGQLSEIEKKETEPLEEEDRLEDIQDPLNETDSPLEEEKILEETQVPLDETNSPKETDTEGALKDKSALSETAAEPKNPAPLPPQITETETEEREEPPEADTTEPEEREALPEADATQESPLPDQTTPQSENQTRTLPTDQTENKKPPVFRSFLDLKPAPGNPPLDYPEEAREMKSEGSISFIFYLTEEGLVEKIQIESSSGHSRLDNFVMRTFARYRFSPNQSGWVRHTVNFVLKGEKIKFLRLRDQ